MRTTLLTGGHIHSPADPAATAMAVTGQTVVWVGADDSGRALYPQANEIRLDGAFVAPAFVDAHVHATATGLLLDGLDLTGAATLNECLDRIGEAAARVTEGTILWGHGWDESGWPERRAPLRAEIDAVANGVQVYASRIDVHSALVSSALERAATGIRAAQGWSEERPLITDAHHVARQHALNAITPEQRERAQLAFLRHAASRGIVAVHECSGPTIAGADDLSALLALSAAEDLPDVTGYWGERSAALPAGACGLAGDLFVDGALGSATAALHEPYLDRPGSSGTLYLKAEQIAEHILACTSERIQAGFHVIGDRAVSEVVAGFASAAERAPELSMRRHRLEHLEMVSAEQAAALGGWGVVASMQPLFDHAWGGVDGMYSQRLGARRAAGMNPFATLAAAGVILAFGSDAPVTPMDPWAAVRAAVHHRTPGAGISARAAFTAHTRGGWRAAGVDDGRTGTLVPGAPANYAVWAVDRLATPAVDERVRRWSTDPHSGVPPLPVLDPEAELPQCLETVLRGTTVYRSGT